MFMPMKIVIKLLFLMHVEWEIKRSIWHQNHFQRNYMKIHLRALTWSNHFAAMASAIFLLCSGVFGARLLPPLGLGIDFLFWWFSNHSCRICSAMILYEFHWRPTPPAKPFLAASATMSLHSTKQPSCTINLCRRKLQPRLTPSDIFTRVSSLYQVQASITRDAHTSIFDEIKF